MTHSNPSTPGGTERTEAVFTSSPGVPYTSREVAEDLLASERQFRAVFEEAFDAIMIADDEGRYVDVNPSACDLFGLPREDLLGRTAAEFAAEGYDIAEAWRDFLESDLDRGLFPLVRADGEERIVEFAATPNILPGRHLSVIRDVTERRKTENELAQERERSERYQRTLAADAVVHLKIRIDDEAVFGQLTDRVDCECEFEGMVSASEGRALQYVLITGGAPDDVRAFADASPDVDDYRVVYETETSVFVEFATTRSPPQVLVEAGARCRSMHSEGGTTTVVAEVRADADVQRPIRAVMPIPARRSSRNAPWIGRSCRRDSTVTPSWVR